MISNLLYIYNKFKWTIFSNHIIGVPNSISKGYSDLGGGRTLFCSLLTE